MATPSTAGGAPQFINYSEAEAQRHPSYLLVTTIPWPTTKAKTASTIEWHTRPEPAQPRNGEPAPAPSAPRIRVLADREPLTADQARERAELLARRNGVPVVMTIRR